MTSFIKKKSSETIRRVFKSTLDHSLKVSPSSSKLFIKLSRQRNLNSSFEKQLIILKYLESLSLLSRSRRSFVNFQFDASFKNTSSSKLLSTSIVGRRSVSLSKDFKLSRILFRKLAAFGILPGISKSSW